MILTMVFNFSFKKWYKYKSNVRTVGFFYEYMCLNKRFSYFNCMYPSDLSTPGLMRDLWLVVSLDKRFKTLQKNLNRFIFSLVFFTMAWIYIWQSRVSSHMTRFYLCQLNLPWSCSYRCFSDPVFENTWTTLIWSGLSLCLPKFDKNQTTGIDRRC